MAYVIRLAILTMHKVKAIALHRSTAYLHKGFNYTKAIFNSLHHSLCYAFKSIVL